jgi:hypothetical protein
MDFFSHYSILEIGDLASSVSRLLTACLGAKKNGHVLRFDGHDRFLLDNAAALMEDVLVGLNFLSERNLTAPGAGKIAAFNCVIQIVLNRSMGTGKDLSTVNDLQHYFESILSTIQTLNKAGLATVGEKEIKIARHLFYEVGSRIPFETEDDDSRLFIQVQQAMLKELKKVAQEEGTPVHKLVADIITSYLGTDAHRKRL